MSAFRDLQYVVCIDFVHNAASDGRRSGQWCWMYCLSTEFAITRHGLEVGHYAGGLEGLPFVLSYRFDERTITRPVTSGVRAGLLFHQATSLVLLSDMTEYRHP